MMIHRISLLLTVVAAIATSGPIPALAQATIVPATATRIAGTVAAELRGKPLVIRVHAAWCAECQTTLPDFLRFTRQYRGKINVIDFDVTDGKTSGVAAALAVRLGLGAYYERTKTKPLTVSFIDPNAATIVMELRGNVDFDDLVVAERAVERELPSR